MRNITLVVLMIVSVCFGIPSIVVNGESIELTEVGEELATKAAEVYLEELYPDSPATMGPAGPVYSLAFDGSIAGWFFVIDAEGESSLTVEEMQEIANFYSHKHFGHYIEGDGNIISEFTLGYRQAMERYEGFYISNYVEYDPLLKHYHYIPFQSSEQFRYSFENPAQFQTTVSLFGTPGFMYITMCFTKADSSRLFVHNYLTFTEVELTDNSVGVDASSGSNRSISKAREVWSRIEQLPATESN